MKKTVACFTWSILTNTRLPHHSSVLHMRLDGPPASSAQQTNAIQIYFLEKVVKTQTLYQADAGKELEQGFHRFLAVEHQHSIHYRVHGNKNGVPALSLII